MSLNILTAENIRDPLSPLLETIIQKHIAHRLVDDFLILTPDAACARDLIQHFLQDPRLGGVLTGRSILPVKEWISSQISEIEPQSRLAPEWLHEILFQNSLPPSFKELTSKNFSLSSLYTLIKSFRDELKSAEDLKSFVSVFDPHLALDCARLFKLYEEKIERSSHAKDERWQVSRLLQGIQKKEISSFHPLKNIYALGFTFASPLLQALTEKIHEHTPHIEQILLLQTPRGGNPQDLPILPGGETSSLFPFAGKTAPPESACFEFASPFDEAGFLVAEVLKKIEKGISPQEIAIFIPSHPFWENYFSSQLEKLGLFSSPFLRQALSSFSSVNSLLKMKPEEALLLSPSSSLTPPEMRAFSEWQEILEEVLFYESEFPKQILPHVNFFRIAETTFLKEKTPLDKGITLRPHKKAGLKFFEHTYIFGMNDSVFPQGPERFFGTPLFQSGRTSFAEHRLFQHLLGAAKTSLQISTSSHSPQGNSLGPSPYLGDFEFTAFETRRHPPLFVSKGSSPGLQQRIETEIQREEDLHYAHAHGGWIQETECLGILKQKMLSHVYTPHQLEAYVSCPFKFFASTLLGLKKTPEQEPEASAADQGNWIHQFLEKFFSAHRSQIVQAGKNPALQKSLEEALQTELTRFSRTFLQEKPWIHEILSEDFKKRALLTLQNYFQNLWKQMEENENPFLPQLFETPFELSHPVKIRGRIDRIDLSEDEKEFMVLDYKTGNRQELGKKIREFKNFQLPIYLKAAEELLKTPKNTPQPKAALLIDLKEMKSPTGIFQKENKKRLGIQSHTKSFFQEEEWNIYKAKLDKTFLEIHEKILSGDFRPLPDPCDPYCDFKNLCRYHERAKSYS